MIKLNFIKKLLNPKKLETGGKQSIFVDQKERKNIFRLIFTYLFALVGLSICIFIIAGILYSLIPQSWLSKFKGKETKKTQPTISESIYRYSQNKQKKWFLEFKNKDEVVKDLIDPKTTLHWQNFLIYVSKTNIFSLNLDNGNSDTVFDQAIDLGGGITNLKIINDTLFFSIGGYLVNGATYWVDLPVTGKPIKIVEGMNGRIEKIRDHYFIIQGEGDAGVGFKKLFLFDLDSKQTTQLVEFKIGETGFGEGDYFLGINKRNELISYFGNCSGTDTVKYLKVRPIFNPTAIQKVITEEQMPKNIRVVKYSEEKDAVFLLGENFYIYNFMDNSLKKIIPEEENSKKIMEVKYSEEKDALFLLGTNSYIYNFVDGSLQKLITVPDEWLKAEIASWKENFICLKKGNLTEKHALVDEQAEINLENQKFSKNTTNCPSLMRTEETEKSGMETFIKALNLPENYKIVQE